MEDEKPDYPENEILSYCSINREDSVESEFLELYLKAFTKILKTPRKQFPLRGIEYQENQHRQFSYQIQQQNNNYEVVVLKVYVGCFTLRLSLLNLDRNSPLSRIDKMAEGNYGSIYSLNLHGNSIAVKSFATDKLENKKRVKVMARIIEEYSIYKICDCLGCGPSVEDCFGFNILAFKDRIEFAMEKCQPVPISESRHIQMLENLWVLHQFKIIHYDITSDNFMFSRTHQKVVFIDFGLSKIISEDCGFKTYTSFRGTPTFVSEPMLDLLGPSNKSNFVDLYYNDLVCLQKILTFRKIKARFSETFGEMVEEESDSQSSVQFDTPPDLDTIIREYQFFRVKHQAFFDLPCFEATLKAENRILIKTQGRKVLQLVQSFLPSPFFQRLLFQELKELSKLDEYQRCLETIKNRYVSPSRESVANQFLNRFFEKQQFEECDGQQKQKLILEFINDQHSIEEENEKIKYFSLIFDCIRFDIKNYDIGFKKQLAGCFLKSMQVVPDESGDMNSIRQVIGLLLSFCLSLPLNGWKKNHRFDMLTQGILLEVLLLGQLATLESYIGQQGYFQREEMMVILVEYALLDSILELKYQFDNFDYYQKVIATIKKGEVHAMQKIIQLNEGEKTQNSGIVADVLDTLMKGETVMGNSQLYAAITCLRDRSVKNPLLKYVVIKEIQRTVFNNDYSEFILLLGRIQVELSQELRGYSFGEQLYWKGLFSQEVINIHSKEKLGSGLRQKINCDLIYNRLKFYLFDVWSQKGADQAVFQQTVLDLLNSCFLQKRILLFIGDFQQILIIFQCRQELRVNSLETLHLCLHQYLDYMEELFQNATNDTPPKKITAIPLNSRQHSMTSLRTCEGFVYYFLLMVGNPFQEHIVRYQQIVSRHYWRHLQSVGTSIRGSEDRRLPQFFYYIMLRQRAMSQNNVKSILSLNKKLAKICDGLIPPYIFKQLFLHQSKMIMKIRMKEGQIATNLPTVLVWGWRYHKLNNRILAYFEENNTNRMFIAHTISFLWQSHCLRDEAFQFMHDIIQAISSRPLFLQVNVFIRNVNFFYNYHPDFFEYSLLVKRLGKVDWSSRYKAICYVLSLSTVPLRQKIPFMKSLVVHVDMLNWAAKQQVLNFLLQNLVKMVTDKKLIWSTRKLVTILRFLATKIEVQFKSYQKDKIRHLLSLLHLGSKPGSGRLLRDKIRMWSKVKISKFHKMSPISTLALA